MRSKRLHYSVILVAGAWLLCSPFLLRSYDAVGVAAIWGSYAAGAVVVILATIALMRPRPWQDWGSFLLGAAIVIAPSVLGFSRIVGGVTWNYMIVGLLVGLEGFSSLAPIGRRPTGER